MVGDLKGGFEVTLDNDVALIGFFNSTFGAITCLMNAVIDSITVLHGFLFLVLGGVHESDVLISHFFLVQVVRVIFLFLEASAVVFSVLRVVPVAPGFDSLEASDGDSPEPEDGRSHGGVPVDFSPINHGKNFCEYGFDTWMDESGVHHPVNVSPH